MLNSIVLQVHFIKIFYLFIFREWGREREKEGEKHQHVAASHVPPNGDVAGNPGMFCEWQLNQQSFGSQVGAQLQVHF